MMLKEMFKKSPAVEKTRHAVQLPDGLFQKCPQCHHIVYTEDLVENQYVCPECGHYWRVGARARISMVLDKGSFTEWGSGSCF